jgi:hypothetical protein
MSGDIVYGDGRRRDDPFVQYLQKGMSVFCCIAKPEWYGIWTRLQSRSSA